MSTTFHFDRPGTVFLQGTSRPLLNWIAWALARDSDPLYAWTDVRLRGEPLDPNDPLALDVIPGDRLSVVHPNEMAPEVATAARARAAAPGLVDPGESAEIGRRLEEFLRLPTHTQEQLAAHTGDRRLTALVLSNAHRIVGHYPTEMVAPILRTIVRSGVVLFLTFADAPPDGRLAFDSVLRVYGTDARFWRGARIEVERVPPESGLVVGSSYPLGETSPFVELLAGHLR